MSHENNQNQDQQAPSGGYHQQAFQQQPFHQQPHFQQQPYYQPPKTNGKSIATLVLGIVSIIIPYVGFLPGIVGIILGILSLKELKASGEQGRGLSIAGLICSIIGTLLWLVVLLIVVIVVIFAVSETDSYYY